MSTGLIPSPTTTVLRLFKFQVTVWLNAVGLFVIINVCDTRSVNEPVGGAAPLPSGFTPQLANVFRAQKI
jgi:hypothetical protein